MPTPSAPTAATPASVANPMLPSPWRVRAVRAETADTATLELVPLAGAVPRFAPGQFNMIYAFGIGEAPISLSGDPAETSCLVHTVRAVGAVSAALARARLRPAIRQALAASGRYRRIAILYGGRNPAELLFRDELALWAARERVTVAVTVDHADPSWHGAVGVVPALLDRVQFDPAATVALLCGPEVMLRFTAAALRGAGVSAARIFVSMERNMKCAVGLCGHCQFGPDFMCKDGPVLPYDRIAARLAVREI